MSKFFKTSLAFLFLLIITQTSIEAAIQNNIESEIQVLVIQKQNGKSKVTKRNTFKIDESIVYTTNNSNEKLKGKITGFSNDSMTIQDEFGKTHIIAVNDLSSIKRELSSSKKFLRFLLVLFTVALIIGILTQFLWYIYLGFVVGIGLSLRYVDNIKAGHIYGLATIPFLPFLSMYVLGIFNLRKYKKYSLKDKWKAEIQRIET